MEEVQWQVIVALAGTVATLAGLVYRSERERRIECCYERDELRKEADALLKAFQQRDDEERKLWQTLRGGGDPRPRTP